MLSQLWGVVHSMNFHMVKIHKMIIIDLKSLWLVLLSIGKNKLAIFTSRSHKQDKLLIHMTTVQND